MTFTTRVPGAILTEREHTVPLDHARPDGPTITVFTREVADPDGTERPYLVFLQGGPGMEATRPTSPPTGWMARALKDYRVLLLDQRGTGRSTPVGAVIPGDTPEAQATYLTHFRADFDRPRRGVDPGGARCRSLEHPRPELRWLHGHDLPVDRPGGSPRGVPDRRPRTDRTTDRRRLHARPTAGSSNGTSATTPATRRIAPGSRRSISASTTTPFLLPSGDRLTSRRFRQIGLWLGDSAGWELLHHVLELPMDSPGVRPRRRRRGPVQPEPAVRDPPRVVVRRRGRHALVGRPAAARRDPRRGRLHRRARLPLDVRRLRAAPARTRPPPGSSPSTPGRSSTTPPSWPSTRSRSRRRSTSTTCTSSGRTRRRRRRPSAVSARGSPTSTSTTGSAPTASTSSAA